LYTYIYIQYYNDRKICRKDWIFHRENQPVSYILSLKPIPWYILDESLDFVSEKPGLQQLIRTNTGMFHYQEHDRDQSNLWYLGIPDDFDGVLEFLVFSCFTKYVIILYLHIYICTWCICAYIYIYTCTTQKWGLSDDDRLGPKSASQHSHGAALAGCLVGLVKSLFFGGNTGAL